jgi:diguanylate cyclase (GGDEF)-like protein
VSTRPDRGFRVLVVEDEPEIALLLQILLERHGFEVIIASDGQQALDMSHELLPDLVLLDIMLPKMDGLTVCRKLRANPLTRRIAVIMVSGKVSMSDKLEGLRAGADDYVAKPFTPDELLERVHSVLRRSTEMAILSPLTGLPGNRYVEDMLVELISEDAPFAFMHADIDNFKSFNDHYGLMRGDLAINLLARCLADAVAEHAAPRALVGHIGGDDFVVIVEPEEAKPIADDAIAHWDRSVRALYDPTDADAGHIVVPDRRMRPERFPLMTISIGIASTAMRSMQSHLEVGDIAAEMKQLAKRDTNSSYAIDKRRGEAAAPLEHDREMSHGLISKGSHHPRLSDLSIQRSFGTLPSGEDVLATVLIVEGKQHARFALRVACELLGFGVVGDASNGMEAWELATEHMPDLVILDYMMPGMTGEEAAARMRTVAPTAKIVAFSSMLKDKPPWADAYLVNYDISEISGVLQSLIAGREPNDR